VISNTGTKKKHLISNPPQRKYKVVEDLKAKDYSSLHGSGEDPSTEGKYSEIVG